MNRQGVQVMRAGFAFLAMALTGLSTASLSPQPVADVEPPALDDLLPDEFGEWERVPLSSAVLPAESELGPGEAVAYRAYVDGLGRVVTLVAAYGPPLGDSVRLHRPETCYVAQGFAIADRRESEIAAPRMQIPVVHLLTESPARNEAVTYWIRDGAAFTTGAEQSQIVRGLSSPLDGALVRVSSRVGAAPLFGVHEEFLKAFSKALDEEGRRVFISGDAL